MTLLLLAGLVPASATTFATDRLQSIAKCLQLPGLDNLTEGNYTHYKYRTHALNVRVNKFGEIEHIGLCLFPEWRRNVSPSPIYDFLERNLLERQLTGLDGAIMHKLQNEHVYFIIGSAQTAMKLDTLDVNGFSEERVDLKSYRTTWVRNGREVLKITFDMDFQMLSGCDAMELERRYATRLVRFQPDVLPPNTTTDFPVDANSYVQKGDTLFIKEMRNDLYYEQGNNGWQLSCNPQNPNQFLNNMLISPYFQGNPILKLSLKKYTYEDEGITLPYRKWLLMCQKEGCITYFGIKEKTTNGYTGTVVAVNRRAGFAHLLSVEVDEQTLQKKGNGTINARLYIYIPLHNVSEQYFKKQK
jgi:hypothetical protein